MHRREHEPAGDALFVQPVVGVGGVGEGEDIRDPGADGSRLHEAQGVVELGLGGGVSASVAVERALEQLSVRQSRRCSKLVASAGSSCLRRCSVCSSVLPSTRNGTWADRHDREDRTGSRL